MQDLSYKYTTLTHCLKLLRAININTIVPGGVVPV
jgi:hypothetical protein